MKGFDWGGPAPIDVCVFRRLHCRDPSISEIQINPHIIPCLPCYLDTQELVHGEPVQDEQLDEGLPLHEEGLGHYLRILKIMRIIGS